MGLSRERVRHGARRRLAFVYGVRGIFAPLGRCSRICSLWPANECGAHYAHAVDEISTRESRGQDMSTSIEGFGDQGGPSSQVHLTVSSWLEKATFSRRGSPAGRHTPQQSPRVAILCLDCPLVRVCERSIPSQVARRLYQSNRG